tara:strand:- start:64 stop:270 length:207 start_codon:yes stop_codon:yes gene_type:complete
MKDKRAVTSKGMDETLKNLGLTIQSLIDAEEKMRRHDPSKWNINKKKIEDLKRKRSLMIAQAKKKKKK